MMPAGRPLKFESVEELQSRIDAYFNDCDPHMEELPVWEEKRNEEGKLIKDEYGYNEIVLIIRKRKTEQKPYTITGLALALGTSRQCLVDYEDREEFFDTIKAAKLRCEQYAEKALFSASPTGSIFNLKNNYGWKEKTETDINAKVERVEPAEKTAVDQFIEQVKNDTANQAKSN